MEITGAELFIKALKEESVTTLFAYPGGQAIASNDKADCSTKCGQPASLLSWMPVALKMSKD